MKEASELNNPKSFEVKTLIKKHLEFLLEIEVQSEVGKETSGCAKLLLSEAFDDNLNYASENMMREVIKLYHQLEIFREGLPNFERLYNDFGYDQLNLELKEKRNHLVHFAAQYIVREELDIEALAPTGLSDLFVGNEALYKEITSLVGVLGGKNFLAEDLLQQLEKQKEAAYQLLKQTGLELTTRIEELSKSLSEKTSALEQGVEDKEKLTSEIRQVKDELELLKKSSSGRISELEQDVQQKAKEYKEELERQKQVAARVLEEETKRLTLEKEALERELTAKLQLATKEHGTEKEQLTQEILKLQQQLEELGAEREKVIRQLQESVQSKAQEYELAVKELKDEKDSAP